VRVNQSSADPLFPSFVFTLAATGTTLSISIFSPRRIERMAGSVEFLGWLGIQPSR